MEPGIVLQIIMILAGVYILFVAILSLAKRKMTEPFCLTWGFSALLIILAGILLRPSEWNRYLSETGLFLVVLLGFCAVYGVYFISSRVSELMRKNNELAITVSLLIKETEELREELEKLENPKDAGDEKE